MNFRKLILPLLLLASTGIAAREIVYLERDGVIRYTADDTEVAVFGSNYCVPSVRDSTAKLENVSQYATRGRGIVVENNGCKIPKDKTFPQQAAVWIRNFVCRRLERRSCRHPSGGRRTAASRILKDVRELQAAR